jgi:hypothetical protein
LVKTLLKKQLTDRILKENTRTKSSFQAEELIFARKAAYGDFSKNWVCEQFVEIAVSA